MREGSLGALAAAYLIRMAASTDCSRLAQRRCCYDQALNQSVETTASVAHSFDKVKIVDILKHWVRIRNYRFWTRVQKRKLCHSLAAMTQQTIGSEISLKQQRKVYF